MRKYLATIILGLCCVGNPVYGQEETTETQAGMTFDELLETAKTDQIFQKQSKDRIGLLDINSDGIISYNEITNAATSVSEIPENMADETQKEEMKGYLLEAFEDSDTDLDNKLTAAEIDSFIDKMRYFILRQKFDSMDKNKDGIYDAKDMPSIEESQAQIEESIQQMQKAMDKLERMNANEIAQNMIKNIGSAVADEDFYQMDSDQDGCLTREEYVNYQMMADSDSEDENTKMSALDYGRWYIEIKKAKTNCITKEEYIAHESMPIEKQLDDEENEKNPENEKMYAELLFDEIDADLSGKITAEEYAEYYYQRDVKLYAPNEPIMKQETYYNMFLKIKAPEKGWMSKEEFVTDYLHENVKDWENEENTEIENTENEDTTEDNKKENVDTQTGKKNQLFSIIEQ